MSQSSAENLHQLSALAAPPRVLWVDDDDSVLQSAERLFRGTNWTLVQAKTGEEAQEKIKTDQFAVIVADQRLKMKSGIDILEFAKSHTPSTSRILLTGQIDTQVIEEAVNRGHVFRFVAKPWENELLIADISKAIEHHRLRMTQATLLREVGLQNKQLERLTSGLEQIVIERTLTAEDSKVEAEQKLAHVRDLVRFIKDLVNLNSIEELMGLIRKELKGFHELRPPALAYIMGEKQSAIVFFQGKQVVERAARQAWSDRPRIRINELDDRIYLANEFGRPFVKVIAVPLKRRPTAGSQSQESPATLFFEHAFTPEQVDLFLSYISERLQPLSIALDRILLEYHLKYTSVQWEGTFDGIKDPIAIVDTDFQVVRSNRHFQKDSGVRSFEQNCHRLFAGLDSVCRGCCVQEALATGEPKRGLVRRNNRTYEVSSYPIRLKDEAILSNVINHYVDVTNSRELHSRMIQSEKMAAIGLLAGNIAHELNNPLTGIRGLAQVLLQELPKQGTLSDDIKEVEKAAERSQRIIENLLDFSKGETEQKQTVIGLNEIVHRTLPMLKTAIRDHRSEMTLTESECNVKVEPHLMQQVVFNLVNNACQAMKEQGTIGIETCVDPDSKWVELKVIDTGVGIPPELLDQIFEPFFTTKEKGQGTGLGLSMSKSIIEKFGGELKVKSKIGTGTEFSVRLPLVMKKN